MCERQHNPRNRVVVSLSDCLRLAIEGVRLVVRCWRIGENDWIGNVPSRLHKHPARA